MNCTYVRYGTTGTIQSFEVPATGHYWIEAASAQSHGKRVCSKALFQLKKGDVLRIVVGRMDGTTPSAGFGQGGCSFVWQRAKDLTCNQHVMLVTTGVPITYEEASQQVDGKPGGDWPHPEDGYVMIFAAAAKPPAGTADPFHGMAAGEPYIPPSARARLRCLGEESGDARVGPGL